ncbi:MAG: hypothetical protein ACJAQ0_001524 [Dasania sp.]|jgi:hypothetical protein
MSRYTIPESYSQQNSMKPHSDERRYLVGVKKNQQNHSKNQEICLPNIVDQAKTLICENPLIALAGTGATFALSTKLMFQNTAASPSKSPVSKLFDNITIPIAGLLISGDIMKRMTRENPEASILRNRLKELEQQSKIKL